jgi:hypothetical protein
MRVVLSLPTVCTVFSYHQVHSEVIILVFLHWDIKYTHHTYSSHSQCFTHTHAHLFPPAMITCYLHYKFHVLMSCGSSGSIVSDYGLDDRAIEVRSLMGAEDFSSSPCVQTGSGAHPASYPMGTGGPFPRGKAQPRCDADHSPPSSAEVKYE